VVDLLAVVPGQVQNFTIALGKQTTLWKSQVAQKVASFLWGQLEKVVRSTLYQLQASKQGQSNKVVQPDLIMVTYTPMYSFL